MAADTSRSPEEIARLSRLLRDAGSTVEVGVDGESMAPSLTTGDLVSIRCAGTTLAGPGEVVAFLAGGRVLTIHRVVYVRSDHRYLLTRGDANLFCDPPVPAEDVMGTVVAFERADRRGVVPPPPPRRGLSSLVAGTNAASARVALRVHVRLAQGVALASLALALPFAVLSLRGAPRRPPILRMLSLRRPTAD